MTLFIYSPISSIQVFCISGVYPPTSVYGIFLMNFREPGLEAKFRTDTVTAETGLAQKQKVPKA